MESVDFGCRVRVLHRRRLAAGTLPSSLNAAEFLATVKKKSLDRNCGVEWTQLRLSHSGGLRMSSAEKSRKDEGFESDGSDPSIATGSSSGVGSEFDENEDLVKDFRVKLADVLSCQNPAALPGVVLLTLRCGAEALDVLALECCADETARVLTHLFTQLCSGGPEVASARARMRSKSVRSVWNLIQRTDPGGLTHLQVANPHSEAPPPVPVAEEKLCGSQRSVKNVMAALPASGLHTKMLKKKKNSKKDVDAASCIVSMQTPELPLPAGSSASGNGTNRWIFGVTPRLPPSSASIISSASSANVQQPPGSASGRRGRSTERKKPSRLDRHLNEELEAVLQTQLDQHRTLPATLPAQPEASLPATPTLPPKMKRDHSKTRSFLMKLTGNKNPEAPEVVKKERGRSLLRLRSNARTPSQAPPPLPVPVPVVDKSQTFLIPTKSGHELTRNIYPKESPYIRTQQHQQHPLYHLVQAPPMRTQLAYQPSGYSTIHPWYWSDPSDPNNNQHWIYYHPQQHPQHPQHLQQHPQQQQQQPMTKAELMRLRSRSQSPGRRWLPATPTSPSPLHLYDASGCYQPVPLPLPPTACDAALTQADGGGNSRRRSRSRSGRTPSVFQRSFSRRNRDESDALRKVTFNAYATVQLVDAFAP